MLQLPKRGWGRTPRSRALLCCQGHGGTLVAVPAVPALPLPCAPSPPPGGKGSPPSVPAAAMEGGVQLLNRDGHSISHNSKRHYHDAFVCMNRMRQRGLLCDIVLHVATKEIKAHKVVLASCSPYFHAMFTNEMSESRQTHVTLHDIDPQALEQLVQYAYTAEIVVGEGNVQTLLPAASLLQLNGVRDACCKFLLSQLDPSNCLGIRGFADTHSCSDLLKSAHKYVLQHFVEVSKTEEFMLLPLKQVLDLISSDSLNVPSEEEVYRAVLSWVKHDVDSRRQHVPRVSGPQLLSNVDTELLVRHHSECKDLLIEALKYHLMPEQRGVLSNSRTRPRRCEGASTVLFAVGKALVRHAALPLAQWWPSMSRAQGPTAVLSPHSPLTTMSDLATVESYDPVTNSWQPEVSMGTRRSCLGVAALHGLLYAAGGYDGASCLNSAERYDPLTGTWTSIAAMSTRRRYVRVATLEGNLYAVGGYDSSSHLATVEKESRPQPSPDPSQPSWGLSPLWEHPEQQLRSDRASGVSRGVSPSGQTHLSTPKGLLWPGAPQNHCCFWDCRAPAVPGGTASPGWPWGGPGWPWVARVAPGGQVAPGGHGECATTAPVNVTVAKLSPRRRALFGARGRARPSMVSH
uniref:BTB domain-containing protein n=1 Tax=Malurus cyaneus samueli TaxID=2593467 RepID=A0A8C5U902_9PASS